MKPTQLSSLIHSFMVLTLVFSMLAPSVCSILDVELSSIVMQDFHEEETQKKGESENKEKEIVRYELNFSELSALEQVNHNFVYFPKNEFAVDSEIILPPPETLI